MNTLRKAVREYLEMRRSLGFKLREAGKGLIDFVTFHGAAPALPSITQALALAWAQQPSNAQPAQWARRLSFVRGFARYRSATDPRTQIPPPGLLPFRPKRARPYLYSEEEIRSLLRAALRMPCRYKRGKLRPWVYLLSVRTAERFRSTPRRSTQPRTSGCRSEGGGVDDPRRQVRQDSPGAFARLDLRGAGGLHRPPSAPLGGTSGVLLSVRFQQG